MSAGRHPAKFAVKAILWSGFYWRRKRVRLNSRQVPSLSFTVSMISTEFESASRYLVLPNWVCSVPQVESKDEFSKTALIG